MQGSMPSEAVISDTNMTTTHDYGSISTLCCGSPQLSNFAGHSTGCNCALVCEQTRSCSAPPVLQGHSGCMHVSFGPSLEIIVELTGFVGQFVLGIFFLNKFLQRIL